MADVDWAIVEQRFGTVRILLNPIPCNRKSIQSNSMISQSFDAVVHPSAWCGSRAQRQSVLV